MARATSGSEGEVPRLLLGGARGEAAVDASFLPKMKRGLMVGQQAKVGR